MRGRWVLAIAAAALSASCGGGSPTAPSTEPALPAFREPPSAKSTQAPTVDSFLARPAAIDPGQSAVLSWSTTGASSVLLEFPTGAAQEQPPNGSLSLAFARRGFFTFTLTAIGEGGSTTATTSVSVGDAAPNGAPALVLRTRPSAVPDDPFPVIRGAAPLTVSFNLCDSSDPDQNPDLPEAGDTLNWQFHFGDDGTEPLAPDGTFNANVGQLCRTEHTYRDAGRYTATVSVTDKHLEDQRHQVGALARQTQQLTIIVGGTACVPVSTSFDAYAPFTPGGALGIPGVSFAGGETDFSFFSSLTGIVFFNTAATTTIRFSDLHDGFRFDFAHALDPIRMEVRRSGSAVSTSTLFGSIPPGFFFPEGVASSSGPLFDEIRLSNTSGFAIDNFNATCP